MKFKAVAFLCIGVLLGSTITLASTRSSKYSGDVLACTDKASGKTRLTISGECDESIESAELVTDLWGLQQSTSAPPASTPTTTKALKKHVVDANGKDLGELLEASGLDFFWIDSESGVWQVAANSESVLGKMYGELFSDSKCRKPYLWAEAQSSEQMRRAVIFVRRDLPKTRKKEGLGFRPVGQPIKLPKVVYAIKGYGNEFLTCIRLTPGEAAEWENGQTTNLVYKSAQVALPTYEAPLSIVEK